MWTLQDAKNKFSALVEEALAGRPQRVSRRGKPAVVVISVQDFDRLNMVAAENRRSFKDHLRDFPDLDEQSPIVKLRDVDL